MDTETPVATLSDPDTWLKVHGDYLYAYALRQLRDPSLAEETVQETLIAAWQGRAGFGGGSSERTWLTGILKHKIIDCYRRRRREALLEPLDEPSDRDDGLSAAAFAADGHWTNPPQHWGNPENALDRKRLVEALAECLKGLSRPQQTVFSLRELSGVDTDAICKELGITATNLWVILYRARLALKECLEQTWAGGADAAGSITR